MRCRFCGNNIPEGMLHCPTCGREVRIVPDYNPIDDVVTNEIKGSVSDSNWNQNSGATRNINTTDVRRYSQYSQNNMGYTRSTRALNDDDLTRFRSDEKKAMEAQRNRREAMRKKRQQKKRRQRIILIIVLTVAVIALLCSGVYMNSYSRYISKGNKATAMADYNLAEDCFKKAMEKNMSKSAAYTGLSDMYLEKGDMQKAESVFLSAVAKQPSNIEIYKAAISFYEKTKQTDKISELLGECEYESVLAAFPEYISEKPEFSLAEGVYDEVQQVSLSAQEGDIYYTTDGTEPTNKSEKYSTPILVQDEGETCIKAIAVNKKGIPSLIATSTYSIQFPIEDAPSVTPSTGQYESATKITINVPEGYTAYYTTDDTDPSVSDTAVAYEEPVDMPEGQTMFSAVLYNNTTQKYTLVTKRNYVLEL